MKYVIIFYVIISFLSVSNASIKENIIKSFGRIDNLSFNFTQTVNGKDESGSCIISYPKKIYCKYNLRFNKILVSNGNSLVLKSDKNNQYYRYPLNNTPLVYLLDKSFILKKIKGLELKVLNQKYFYFAINHENQFINLFFDMESLNLIGWQTEDIYQNLTITYIYEMKTNQKVDEKVFKLPKNY